MILFSFSNAFSFSVGFPCLTNVLCSSAFLATRKFISFSSIENRKLDECVKKLFVAGFQLVYL